jgi:hypothetical protein
MIGEKYNKSQDSGKSAPPALTSIHDAYTLAAANEGVVSEVDQLIVSHFMETIANIAIAVATRKLNSKG